MTATIINSAGRNEVVLESGGNRKLLTIPAKSEGQGSAVSGGELLLLSIATCFCNDVYREARKAGVQVDRVEVSVTGKFLREGEAGTDIAYRVNITSPAAPERIRELIRTVDQVAEIHKTLRTGVPVTLIHD